MDLRQYRCDIWKFRVSFLILYVLYSLTNDGYLVKDCWRNLLTGICSLNLRKLGHRMYVVPASWHCSWRGLPKAINGRKKNRQSYVDCCNLFRCCQLRLPPDFILFYFRAFPKGILQMSERSLWHYN